jgi:hypothetical protein
VRELFFKMEGLKKGILDKFTGKGKGKDSMSG